MRTIEPAAGASPADAEESAGALGDHGHWQRTSPFAVLFFFGGVVKGLVANATQLAASIGTLIVLVQQGPAMVAWGGAGLAAWFGVAATLRFWFFRYSLEEDRVRIRQGVLKKTELDVQFDRIQGVHVEQSLIFRLLGLVTVGFDTAGSTQQEGKLPAVSPGFATALRTRIEQARKAQPGVPSAFGDAAASDAGATAEESEPLVRLGAADMVRIGLADRSVLAGLAFVPLALQAFNNTFREWTKTRLEHMATEFQELDLLAAGLVVAGVLTLVLALVFAVTICSAFLRYHDFTLFAAGSGNVRFRSVRGLFTRKETAVERAKIQQLHLSQGLLFRRFGRFHLRALPAASGPAAGPDAGADKVLHVPALATEAVRPLADKVFAAEGERLGLLPTEGAFARISPAYIDARLRAVGVAPALVAPAALYPYFGAASFWCLAWLPLAALVVWQLWRRHGYMHTDDALSKRGGLLGFTIDAFVFRKVQAVLVRQSPLQRRRNLATLYVALASGAVKVPYIDYAAACRLRDYMLYKVESSRGPWH